MKASTFARKPMDSKRKLPSELAFWIRESREMFGVSQYMLAIATGIDRSAISAVENGNMDLTAQGAALCVSALLGFAVEYRGKLDRIEGFLRKFKG